MTVHVIPIYGPRGQLRAENTHLAMIREFTFEILESAERYQCEPRICLCHKAVIGMSMAEIAA
jgi:hypothetical protein